MIGMIIARGELEPREKDERFTRERVSIAELKG
jgi:hypothetical protein